jgi:hypothetical protein
LHQFNEGQSIDYRWIVIERNCQDQTLAAKTVLGADIAVDIGALTPIDCRESLSVNFSKLAQAFLDIAEKLLIALFTLECFNFTFDTFKSLLIEATLVKECIDATDSERILRGMNFSGEPRP